MMSTAAPNPVAIAKVVAQVMRNDRGRLLAALAARLRDMQLAEDALQDAVISALSHWGRSGLPISPQGWLLKVALRKAIDRLRSQTRAARNLAELTLLAEEEAQETPFEAIADERLRLIFTCCHPAIEPKSRVALTLRALGGLSTVEIAAVFLDSDVAMGQRLSRAKAKITAARIPFATPDPEHWPDRLHSVLTVIYLIFTRGYAAGPARGVDLCEEALFLARLLNDLRPKDAEIEGALALMLITHARAGARAQGGQTVILAAQDRTQWDHAMLDEGRAMVAAALARRNLGPFQLKAAIAACHIAHDWPQIAALYAVLLQFEDTPVVRLSQAVALAETQGVAAGLAALAVLDADLDGYGPYHAARADFLARSGAHSAAQAAYDRAIDLCPSAEDAAYLQGQRDRLLVGPNLLDQKKGRA